MAQKSIREFQAKNLFAKYTNTKYHWRNITSIDDFGWLDETMRYIIKPDHMFGKRWKYGLIWLNLSLDEAKSWYLKNKDREIQIWKTSWKLSIFLLEEYIEHSIEYYVSINQKRDNDEIIFSNIWWVDVEENWDKIKKIQVWVLDSINKDLIRSNLWDLDDVIVKIIIDLFNLYRDYDFTYLEVNPFTIDKSWNIILLDMVAKLDDQSSYIQKSNWWELEFPSEFWRNLTPNERYIEDLDSKTWASMKLTFLNPNGSIWLLLSWWGWSLVVSDTLWYLWYAQEIANYWELSGNPDRENTYIYTKVLVQQMLQSPNPKYLIIAWAIANFTRIDKTFEWVIDVFREYALEIKSKNIKILVRRWWLNDTKGLKLLEYACNDLWLDHIITGGESYMTNILKKIQI